MAKQLAERLKLSTASEPASTYAALMRMLVIALLDMLRADPIMQKIIAWEISSPSPLAARMIAERSRRLSAWMHAMRGTLQSPEEVDAPAINAVLIASTQHLVLSGSANGVFAGMPLKTEDDWSRVRNAMSALVTAIYPD